MVTGFLLALVPNGFHCRKEENIADGISVRQKHDHPVDADADPSRWRHAVFQSVNEILIHHMRLFLSLIHI